MSVLLPLGGVFRFVMLRTSTEVWRSSWIRVRPRGGGLDRDLSALLPEGLELDREGLGTHGRSKAREKAEAKKKRRYESFTSCSF